MNGPGLSLALLCALWLLPASALAENAEDRFVQTRDRLTEKIETATAKHLTSRTRQALGAGEGLSVVPASADLSVQRIGADPGLRLDGEARHRERAAVHPGGGSPMTCAVEEDPPILACTVWGRSAR